ncbi:MAG: hypothetical protein O7D93_05580, partial [Acidobacteria bacterium]|nr:hypothetical protein [Acidobacteriota bacterium]
GVTQILFHRLDLPEQKREKSFQGYDSQLLEIQRHDHQSGGIAEMLQLHLRPSEVVEKRGLADPSVTHHRDPLRTLSPHAGQDSRDLAAATKELIRILNHYPVEIGIQTGTILTRCPEIVDWRVPLDNLSLDPYGMCPTFY